MNTSTNSNGVDWASSFAEDEVAYDDTDECHLNAGDTAFMMFAATVVMMQTPAMGLAQAGMIRRKNALSMLMQVLFGMVIGSLLWALFGFSMSFGPSRQNGFIGDPLYFFALRNVPASNCIPDLADSIPGALFCSFHMMFALMAPLVVTGSWAEKMTFEAYLVFVTLWPIFVYYPMVHWVWSPEGWLAQLGVTDFAGGIVIHANVGVAGFVASVMLQRRKLHHGALSHHNLPLSFAGAALVWSGWYSFNGGSALKANYQAAGALLNTHLSACSGALVWSLWNFRDTRMWNMTECVNGAFAGLGGITAASGFVEPWAAMVIGLITSTASFFSAKFVKDFLKLDDVLGVVSLQGTSGVIGSLLVGLFCTESMVPGGYPNGLLYGGGPGLLWAQCLGAAVVIVWSASWSYGILLFMKYTVGIDITHEVEAKGLDIVQMGEQAYDQRLNLIDDIGGQGLISLLNEACSNGDVEAVKALIETQDANPEWSDFEGRKPVHIAAAAGNIAVLEYLCNRHQVDLNAVDNNGRKPLWHACQRHQHETIVWIREKGGTVDRSFIETDIFDIVASGDKVEDLVCFIEAGVDFDFWDYDKRTPLMIAASNGHENIISLLLNAGADATTFDRWGRNAEHSAKLGRHVECAELLSKRNRINVTVHEDDELLANEAEPLLPIDYYSRHSAAEESVGSCSRMNSRNGSDLLASVTSSTSSKMRSRNDIEVVSDAGAHLCRSLCAAASEGDTQEVERLIAKGGDPRLGDYDGRTPLHLAAANGFMETVEFLLKLEQTNVNSIDRWFSTPASAAESNGHPEIAEFLKDNGAITINRHLGSELCQAAADGNLNKLIDMKQKGVDFNTGDYDSRTAMHLAASEGYLEIVQYLIANGAHVLPKDRFGGTPCTDAEREAHNNVVEYLKKRGASNRWHLLRNLTKAGMMKSR